MKYFFSMIILAMSLTLGAQSADLFNTARGCTYMTIKERDMIYEINRLRNDPSCYLVYIEPLLEKAKKVLAEDGRGSPNYSLTTTTYDDGRKKVDTTWHFVNEEEVKALTTLVDDLKRIKQLSILKPDAGIYKAASKHAADQRNNNWCLGHTGTDGSNPWDRITRFSPAMSFGNENIAGNSGTVTARDIVLQLLIDSGIPGYGHRYNMLDPTWTHIACKGERYRGMDWWIQNFGAKKKPVK